MKQYWGWTQIKPRGLFTPARTATFKACAAVVLLSLPACVIFEDHAKVLGGGTDQGVIVLQRQDGIEFIYPGIQVTDVTSGKEVEIQVVDSDANELLASVSGTYEQTSPNSFLVNSNQQVRHFQEARISIAIGPGGLGVGAADCGCKKAKKCPIKGREHFCRTNAIPGGPIHCHCDELEVFPDGGFVPQ